MRTRLSLIAAALLSSALAFPVAAQEAPDAGAAGQAPVVKPPEAGGVVQDGKADRVTKSPAQPGGQPDAAASDTMKQDGKAAGATQDEPASESAGTDAMKKQPGQAGAESDASTTAEGQARQTEGETGAAGTRKTEGTAATTEDSSRTTEGTASTTEQGASESEGTASTTEGQSDNVSRETTASVDISTEQRTEIRGVIVESAPVPADIDIDVSVGIEVPRTVTLRPLPPRVIEIVPQYERYQFFVLADGRIIIVDPNTYEIVYILAA